MVFSTEHANINVTFNKRNTDNLHPRYVQAHFELNHTSFTVISLQKVTCFGVFLVFSFGGA